MAALDEQLEKLGSVLKSQIMVDMNSWEDWRRPESQQPRGKKFANKRARPHPLPEIPQDTLVDIRQIQYTLLSEAGEAAQVICSWAVGVLAVCVSVADMRGNCKLSELIGLPGAKVAFQLLVLAVESNFVRAGIESAETELIVTVLSATKDPRVVGWILSQYGITHSEHFLRCLHLFIISQLSQNNPLASETGAGGLTKAIGDLAAAHPKRNLQALQEIIGTYSQISSEQADSIASDDHRRFILHYMVQFQQKYVLRGDGGSSTCGGGWLGPAIRFEVRTGFSQFPVQRDDKLVLRPLLDAIEVLFGSDTNRTKKLSDNSLDIGRVLGVFELIDSAIATPEDPGDQDGNGEDVAMGQADETSDAILFVERCKQTLWRLLAREQEMVILLGQVPRTVRGMPQPIPNGLQEAVQRGGRVFNSGPISYPTMSQSSADTLCKRLFSVLRSAARRDSSAVGKRLFVLVCDTAPMLVEILAARMESSAAAKALIRSLVEGWPASEGHRMCVAMFQALQSISEANRGLMFQQLLHVVASSMASQPKPSYVEHLVHVLTKAAAFRQRIAADPIGVGGDAGLLDVAEVVGDLCGALTVNWRVLWACCFRVPLEDVEDAWRMRTVLVDSLALQPTSTRLVDQSTIIEYALRELAKIQDAMSHESFAGRQPVDIEGMVVLARALLALICRLGRAQSSMLRMAMEKTLQILLLPPGSDLFDVFLVGRDDGAANCMLRSSDVPKQAGSDSLHDLESLLKGRLLSRDSGGNRDGNDNLELAEQLLWQNSVRPLPKYPRSGLRDHSHVDDAWAFAKPAKPAVASDKGQGDGQARRPLLVFALNSFAQSIPSGMSVLGQLLEEYYVDSIPSSPPYLLDERLNCTRLELRPIEMELLQDIRQNRDLELILFGMVQDAAQGAGAAKPLISALVVALVVFWNGALGEPTTKRQSDLDFTVRLVSLLLDAYGPTESEQQEQQQAGICVVFPVIAGRDLSRVLHQYVWRWIIHRMPGARDESHKVLRHILRRNIVQTAPLFKVAYPHPEQVSRQ